MEAQIKLLSALAIREMEIKAIVTECFSPTRTDAS